MGVCHSTLASDFSLPFVNVSDFGTAYSGWAAIAEDASTAYTNPAGLVCIPTTQVVLPIIGLMGKAAFNGTTITPPFPFPFQRVETGEADTKLRALFPSFYLAVPYNDRLTFAFSQTVPFGLGSDYGKLSIARYLATESKVAVIDVGPSVGLRITRTFSVGAGFDAHYLMFTLNNMIGPPISFPFDSEFKNHEKGWGYGWHAGVLFQPLPCFRMGVNYLSRVRVHATGDSTLFVPLPPRKFKSNDLKTDASLPDRAQFSIYTDVHPRLALMGTVYYTHWSVLNEIHLDNAVVFGGGRTNLVIPLRYHDTFDYSGGLSFRATQKLSLRTGVQYVDSPSNDKYRSVANPIGKAVVVAVGAHYQQSRCVALDIGYGHSFFMDQPINLVTPLSSAFGTNSAGSNAVGVQLTWNIGFDRL